MSRALSEHGSTQHRDMQLHTDAVDAAIGMRQSAAHPALQRVYNAPVHTGLVMESISAVGILASVVMFVVDVVTDVLLAVTLHNRAVMEGDSIDGRNLRSWFTMTIVIIVVPMVIINITSLLWYVQTKQCLGQYSVLHRAGWGRRLLVGAMHLLLLGPLMRYLDQLYFKNQMDRQMRTIPVTAGGTLLRRLTPMGERHAIMHMVVSRDSSMLSMLHSFLQDAPQLILQIFLLYRMPVVLMEDGTTSYTVTMQVVKITVGLLSLAFSLVSYQQELRRGLLDKPSLGAGASAVCVVWRCGMGGARVAALGSFAAIVKHGIASDRGPEGTGWSGWEGSEGPHDPFTFPVMAGALVAAHWLVMAIWVHYQKSNFCGRPSDGMPRPALEMLYSAVMGWVHVFCFVNHRDTPARDRMACYYTLMLAENTVLIAVWYTQVVTVSALWFRVAVVAAVEGCYLLGLSCMALYYGFLHPSSPGAPPPRFAR